MRRVVYKETREDWYPSYILSTKNYPNPDNAPKLVRVSFMQLSTKQWRVCVWGGDDTGMERDYPHEQHYDALVMFNEIIGLPYINRSDLEKRNFQYA